MNALGVSVMPCENHDGRIALPELLDDLAAIGIMALMVEGGAMLAASFLEADLVDELVLYEGASQIGRSDSKNAIRSPITALEAAAWFTLAETLTLGEDRMTRYTRRK